MKRLGRVAAVSALFLPVLAHDALAQRSRAAGYEAGVYRQSRSGRVQRPEDLPRQGIITSRTPNRDGNFGGPGTGGGSGGP